MDSENRRSIRGFTLVELMIVVSCVSVLLAPLIYLEIKFSARIHGEIFRREMAEAGARTIDWISNDVRNCSEMPETWNNIKADNRNIILRNSDNIIIYQYNEKEKALYRKNFKAEDDTNLSTLKMADLLEDFNVHPLDSQGRAVSISMKFSRQLIKEDVGYSIQGVAVRRLQ